MQFHTSDGNVSIDETARVDIRTVFSTGKNINIAEGACIMGNVSIGDGTYISYNAVVISIGHPYPSDGTDIIDHDVYSKPISIGRDCLIGANSTVLPGVTIDDGSIVGAGSVVLEGTHIPPAQIWAGVPARFIKLRKDHAI